MFESYKAKHGSIALPSGNKAVNITPLFAENEEEARLIWDMDKLSKKD